MDIYRISSEKYASKIQASGAPNRWNKENQYVIYTASTRSLATLEMVAHRNAIMGGLRYKMMTIHVPNNKKIIAKIEVSSLPKDWQTFKRYTLTQNIGRKWYDTNESLILKVPSAIIPQEYNYIINTKHPDFSKVSLLSLEDYNWDKRLL